MLEVKHERFNSWYKVEYIKDEVVYYKTAEGMVGHFNRSESVFRFINADNTVYEIEELK